jgi:spermidine synthase
MAKETPYLWFNEPPLDYDIYQFAVKSFLYEGQTEFQRVVILDTFEYGRVLVLDGFAQSTEEDEYIFHEALVQPTMVTHGDPRDVLIIGGGEGATLREVLAHDSVERLVMVDLDRELVEICKEYLPEWHHGKFDDPRVELVFEDGKQYVERCESMFDVIIIDVVDSLDEDTPATALYTERFYASVRQRLRPGGLLVVQAMELSALNDVEGDSHLMVRNRLMKIFSTVRSYLVFVSSFQSEWAFVVASDGPDPALLSREKIEERLSRPGTPGRRNLGSTLEFYDADAHIRMFTLSKDLKRFLAGLPPPEYEAR